MQPADAFRGLESYDLWMLLVGIALLGASVLPRVLSDKPLAMPMLLLALGWVAVALPLGLEGFDPLEHGTLTEHVTEVAVIVAIMGAGLRIDRPLGWRSWSATWRLLGITMTLTIGLGALVGWYVAAFVPATAMLMGAVISPTDPVLASGVQVGAPGEGSEDEETEEADPTGPGEEDEVRFALTSESGMNDGLVFPFTNMALAMVIAGAHPENWFGTWLLMDVVFKIGLAAALGFGLGALLGRLLLGLPAETPLARSMIGIGALGAVALVYGTTEFAGGYGFIATFFAAIMIRGHRRQHEYHRYMFVVVEHAERLLMAAVLIALGSSIAGGLLEPVDGTLLLSAALLLLVVRPLSGVAGLVGFPGAPWRERLTISFFGVRGVGTLYYLAFALNEESFPGAERLWALVGLLIAASVFMHGVLASPVTEWLDERRESSTA